GVTCASAGPRAATARHPAAPRRTLCKPRTVPRLFGVLPLYASQSFCFSLRGRYSSLMKEMPRLERDSISSFTPVFIMCSISRCHSLRWNHGQLSICFALLCPRKRSSDLALTPLSDALVANAMRRISLRVDCTAGLDSPQVTASGFEDNLPRQSGGSTQSVSPQSAPASTAPVAPDSATFRRPTP